jgi:hypothetical protein
MSYDVWSLFKVRPTNFPVRRIAAMSYLLLRYRETGLLNGIMNLTREAPLNQDGHYLEKGLIIAGEGYWANHFDFGLRMSIRDQTLIGRQRAADIAVNVLLPFTLAWSKANSQPELERQALDLCHRYPKQATNVIERHMMNQLGLDNRLINSAQKQQGLIHIYKNFCTQGECRHCRLSQL